MTLSIGAIARASGLGVSALRFYDAAGVLRPARVDPVTGYRWYDDAQVSQARLVAALRRFGMPLDDIRAVLATRHDPAAAGATLDRHLRRLEDGLADARRQLRLARDLLDLAETPVTRLVVRAADLRAALVSVRYAAGSDPSLPGLCGMLLDVEGDVLRLVATDRYRMAVASVPAYERRGPDGRAVAPLPLIDGLFPGDGPTLAGGTSLAGGPPVGGGLSPGGGPTLAGGLSPGGGPTLAGGLSPGGGLSAGAEGEVELALDADSVTIGTVRSEAVQATFPEYRRLTRTTPTRRVTVTAPELRARLVAGPTRTMRRTQDDTDHEVSVLRVAGGAVDVIDADQPEAIGVNRQFLLEALDAGAADRLVLAVEGPVRPLVITDPRRGGTMSVVMPVDLTPAA